MQEFFQTCEVLTNIKGYGKVIATGGIQCNLIDLKSLEVTKLPNYHDQRVRHTAEYLNGILYIFGGMSDHSVQTCERFDWEDWQYIESLASIKIAPRSIIYGGKIYIAGFISEDIEVYDPDTNTFTIVKFGYRMANKIPFILSNSLKLLYIFTDKILTINFENLEIEVEAYTELETEAIGWSHTDTLTYKNSSYFVYSMKDEFGFSLYQLSEDLKIKKVKVFRAQLT